MDDRIIGCKSHQGHNGPDGIDGQTVHGDEVGSVIDFQAIFQLSLDLICIADIDRATFLRVNPAFTKVLGYCEQELLGVSFMEFIHPDDIEPTRRVIDECLRRGEKVLNFKNRYRCKSGDYRWLNWVSQPQVDKGITIAVAHDVTEEIEAGIRLEKVSKLLNTVLDAIPDVIGVQDPHHHIIRYNKAGYAFLGMTPEQAHGKKCHELIGHAAPCPICATSEVYRTKQVARVEKYVPELDVWLDVRAYPVLDKNGELVHVIEHLRDITREKGAEADLRAAHERLITILDSIDTHIYVVDMASYEIMFINQKMRNDFGRELVGTRCYVSLRAENAPCAHCNNYRLLDQQGNFTGTYAWSGQNPITGRWYTHHDQAIRWIDGRTVRLQIAADITQTKQYEQEHARIEQQLHQAQKMESVGRLAGGVAHDFNNMLMIIHGYTELAMARVEADDPLHTYLEKIQGAAQRSTDLTRQLLAFARKQTVSPKVVDLNDTIENILKLLRPLIGEDIDLAWQPGTEVWPVKIDPTQVDQILTNLCVNARDAIVDTGKVTIETGNTVFDEDYCRVHAGFIPGGYAMLAVSDNGCGMDEETQAHLFEPFFTTKEMGKGTGLGLATVYGVVKQNNGFINVYSEPGRGTTFKIYLPRHVDKTVHATEERLLQAAAQGSETILLVEDEPIILELTTKMLEQLGYTVLAASVPGEAIRLAGERTGHIDLLITDVVMPEMNGLELAQNLRSFHPVMKRLFMSGYTANVIAHHGVLDEGVHFIQKPFTMNNLSAKIREVLDCRNDQ